MSKPENYVFHSYDLHKESSLSHTRFLFNTAKHLRLQSAKSWRLYEMLDEETRAVKARMAIHIHDGRAVSPWRAPFGFLEIYQKMSGDELIGFFSLIETDLTSRGVNGIQLKSYPESYDQHVDLVEGVLKKLHYSITQEVSSIIPVDRKPFEKKIKISERQKLKKAKQLFSFERVKVTHLKEIYTFLEACRRERDQSLSMSLADLKKTVVAFPKKFFLYRVYDANRTVAAAIVIKVSNEILYTFYYAHARKFDNVSPVVFLMAGIYEVAHEEDIQMIDLGTSMLDGKINRSLLHFKKSIGGQNTRKLIFEKDLV